VIQGRAGFTETLASLASTLARLKLTKTYFHTTSVFDSGVTGELLGSVKKKIVYTIQITTSSFTVLCFNAVDSFHHLFTSILKPCQKFHQSSMCHFRAMKMKVCSCMDATIFVLCGVGQILFG